MSDKKIESPLVLPHFELADGETLGGYYSGPDGRLTRFILLPGDNDRASWKKQMSWAQSIGGKLFDRTEGAFLHATMNDEFKPEAYWTREVHQTDKSYAWYQYFLNGHQHCYGTGSKLRARAVRREVI